MIQTPLLEITRLPDHMQLNYRGTLQESNDLHSWTDLNPQPPSPWTFSLEPGEKRFFQIKTAPDPP